MAGDAKLTLPAAAFLFFGAVAVADAATPQNFGTVSALAWWVVVASFIYIIGRLLFGLDRASRY